ncbi:MAG: hypothetical protein AAF567_20865 [Actinomycetota bacterium]
MPNAAEGDDEDKQAFIDAMSTPIPHVLDEPDEFWRTYGITSQPSMVFVAADGTWERRTGAIGNTRLLERLKAMEVTDRADAETEET